MGYVSLSWLLACSYAASSLSRPVLLPHKIHRCSNSFSFRLISPPRRRHLPPFWILRYFRNSSVVCLYLRQGSFLPSWSLIYLHLRLRLRHSMAGDFGNLLDFPPLSKVLFLNIYTVLCIHKYLRIFTVIHIRPLRFEGRHDFHLLKILSWLECLGWHFYLTNFPICFRRTLGCLRHTLYALIPGKTFALPKTIANKPLSFFS